MNNKTLNIEWDKASTSWLVRGHADVLKMLKSKDLVPLASQELPAEILEDPSLHDWRKAVQKMYQQQLGWLDGIMDNLCSELLANVEKEQAVDLVQALISPFCQKLAALSIGLDIEDADLTIFRWADQVFHMQDSIDSREGMQATISLFQSIQQQLQKSEEKHSFCSVFQSTDLDQGVIISQLIQLFVGIATSLPLLLANSCQLLLEQKEFRMAFLKKPSACIHELLRLAGPTDRIYRFALSDIKINDKTIKRGDKIAFQLHLANRDSQVFVEASQLKLKRSAKQHLSFGAGAHSCLGAGVIRHAVISLCTALFRGHQWELLDLEYGGSASIIGLDRLVVSNKSS